MRLSVSTALLVIVSVVGSVDGAPIVSQPFINTATHDGEQFADDTAFGEIGADNFQPASTVSSGTLLQLNWWGNYVEDGDPNDTPVAGPLSSLFDIKFYLNSFDQPATGTGGGPLDSLSGVMAVRDASPTDGVVYGYSLVSPFSLGFDLTSATIYWISIAETDPTTDTPPQLGFVWHEGDDQSGVSLSGTAFSTTNGVNWSPTNGNDFLAFELSTLEITAVPEPSSIALLGMGAFGLVGYGWRRRKQRTDVAA